MKDKIKSNLDIEKLLNLIESSQNEESIDWNFIDEQLGIQQYQKINEQQALQEIKEYCEGINWQIRNRYQKQNDLKILREKLKGICPKFIVDNYNMIQQQQQNEEQKEQKQQGKVEIENRHIWDKLKELKGRSLEYGCVNNIKQKQNEEKIEYVFRFPPEPNGYLHLGHARAIRVNFESAERLKGVCYLRFDDTNPLNQYSKYEQKIIEDVEWLIGKRLEKRQIKHASQYFQQLEVYAQQLIKQGDAYVCFESQELSSGKRKAGIGSIYRESQLVDNLQRWKKMKQGDYLEGEACLRLKIDIQHPNPTMRDPIIYRIRNIIHPTTLLNHQIYPLYDFTHCISDSIENITYSLCTLEFEIRRDLYYFILDKLNLTKPYVYEYSRLNIQNNLLSKRKILSLIKNQKVTGWNDPRLLTLQSMRNRGYCAESINAFIDLISCSRNGNQQMVNIQVLNNQLIRILNSNLFKIMVVLQPVKITLTSYPLSSIQIPFNSIQRTLLITPSIYVDQQDLFRFQPNQVVGLKYLGEFQVHIDSDNQIQLVSIQNYIQKKVYYIHWISQEQSVDVQVKIFNDLFIVDNPQAIDDEEQLLKAVNQDSLIQYVCKFPKDIHIQPYQRYQFERLGYFYVNQDLTFNRIIPI